MTVYSVISLQKIPYIYTVYDRIFGDFPAKNTVHAPCIYRVMANLYHLCCKARVWLVLNRKRGCATCCLYAMGCAATFVVCGVGWVCYLLLVRYGLCSHVCGVWCGLGVLLAACTLWAVQPRLWCVVWVGRATDLSRAT